MAGFFGLLKRERKEKVEQIPVEDLEDWLEDELKEEFRDVYSQGNAIRLRIKERVSAVKGAAEELSQTEVKENELNRPLIPTIRNARDVLTSKVANTASSLDLPEVDSFEDLVRCQEATAQTLKQMNQALTTHGRVVASSMRGGLRRLLGDLKRLQSEADRLSRLVNGVRGRAGEAGALRLDAKRLKVYMFDGAAAEKVVDDTQKMVTEVEAEVGRLAAELESVRGSEAFEISSRTALEVAGLEEEARSYRAEFDAFFSKLKRPLEKYIRVVQLSRDEGAMLQSYIESPSKALTADEALLVEKFLRGLRKVMSEGAVTVKEPDKIIQRINQLQHHLEARRQKLLTVLKSLQSLQEALKDSPISNAARLQERMEEKRREKEEQLRLIEKKRGEAQAAFEQAEKMAADIEKRIGKLSGSRVKITKISQDGSGLNVE